MSTIFLCHASEDKLVAERIQLALVNAGHSVFFDELSLPPGGDFDARICQAIAKCDIFVFLISATSIAQGKFTLTELKFARDKWPSPVGKVLPVNLEGLPTHSLPSYLTAATVLSISGNPASEVRAAVEQMLKELPRKQFWILKLMSIRAWGVSIFFVFVAALAAWQVWTTREKQTKIMYQAGKVFRDTKADGSACDFCPDLVVMPQDAFNMGSLESEPRHKQNESPQHPVRILHKLAVGKYEITRAQFAAFVDKSGYDAGSGCMAMSDIEAVQAGKKEGGSNSWRQPGFSQDDNHPVSCVSWSDAQSYVAWLHQQTGQQYRLLTEAEWEYAARAGTHTSYSWGNDIGDGNANCSRCGSQWDSVQTSPVGSFKPNAFGLYDMHGNVREWVQDCYTEDYKDAPINGQAREDVECTFRVMRGGAWGYVPVSARSAYRAWNYPRGQINTDGFRIAKTLP